MLRKMPISLLMPALSPTMTEGTLARWLKKEGDPVESGDLLAEIETDKATMEFEAVDSGILGKILVPGGSSGVKVNSVIAFILEEGETLDALDQEITILPEKEELPVEKVEIIPEKDRIFASPLAKKIAQDSDIDLSKLEGTGPYGRIIKRDLEVAISQTRAFESIESKEVARQEIRQEEKISNLPLSKMRQVIAERLSESKRTIPHFYLTVNCNVTQLLTFREEINQALKDFNKKISINDFVVMASALALADFPEVNSSWQGDKIINYSSIDLSIAVALDDGLITPIVREANKKSLTFISNEIKNLVVKAKENRLRPDEFQGGSLTISNLGNYGIDQFFAIINPPQSSILAVGAVIKKPIVLEGAIVIGDIMTISLSCDHRVVDGALAANFLNRIKLYLEKPVILI
jgi:pyruvate dehydrogenase E2 component (dihydrolipoamide acetyltransferase)